jgi:hypothetical protein
VRSKEEINTKEQDEIGQAESLLNAADRTADSAESTALATQAIGLLLLYFAKDQRDATKQLEKLMQARVDAEIARINNCLSPFLGPKGV